HLPAGNVQFESPVAAFDVAMTHAAAEDVILVVGSFHTVGEVLEHWERKGE
ncbi:bifunctional tetrahydrofolate synthase/dihydrofolate synthase, partial [Vibrio sinaloensis]